MTNSLREDSIFKKLKFTERWVELGIVNSENFMRLRERYLEGEDTNDEHYRWEAFVNFIKENKNITQELIYDIYDLGKHDPDLAMGKSMRFRTIALDNCPEKLIELAIKDEDRDLSKHALKIKERKT